MNQDVKFPIINMTDYVFEGEKVFFSYNEWESEYTLREKDVKRIPEWKYIDCEGKMLRIKIVKLKKKKGRLSFIFKPSYSLILHLENSGDIISLEDLKYEILLKKNDMFHIYYNKIMTLDEYELKLKNASNYKDVIDIASFEDSND